MKKLILLSIFLLLTACYTPTQIKANLSQAIMDCMNSIIMEGEHSLLQHVDKAHQSCRDMLEKQDE